MFRKLFVNLKISKKISLLLAIPLLALLSTSGILFYEKLHKVEENDNFSQLVDLAVKSSALIHELQKERGASAGFLKSKGAKFGDVLRKIREETDKRKVDIDEAFASLLPDQFGEDCSTRIRSIKMDLKKLTEIRKSIDSQDISTEKVIIFYSDLNTNFLYIISSLLSKTSNTSLMMHIGAYADFLKSKERAGLERAAGAGGFAAGFSRKSITKFNSLITQQEMYLKAFEIFADDEQLKFVEKIMNDPSVKEVERMRQIAIASIDSGNLGGVDPTYWFTTISKKINLLKVIDDKLGNDVTKIMKEIKNKDQNNLISFSIFLGIAIFLIFVLAYFMVKDITSSLHGITDVMLVLAEGNTSVVIPAVKRKNEIGSMARAVNIFKDNMIKNTQMKSEQKEEEIKKAHRQEKIEKLILLFENEAGSALETVASASTQLHATAESMTDVVKRTNENSQNVSSASEQASLNVQTVASAAEELSASIQEISRQVTASTSTTRDAVLEAEKADETVQSLSEAANKVGEVVKLISDIAEQINLLALNATIESARAGEAGKGFAVVASEVKNLAGQTSKATEEIAAQINNIQGVANSVVKVLNTIKDSIENIDEISNSIASGIEEQGAATNEIANNVQTAANGVNEISNNIKGVTNASGEADESAKQVVEASKILSIQAEKLKEDITTFINEVKTA